MFLLNGPWGDAFAHRCSVNTDPRILWAPVTVADYASTLVARWWYRANLARLVARHRATRTRRGFSLSLSVSLALFPISSRRPRRTGGPEWELDDVGRWRPVAPDEQLRARGEELHEDFLLNKQAYAATRAFCECARQQARVMRAWRRTISTTIN
jgi:hypothetical protein